jgi:hypothetical protein
MVYRNADSGRSPAQVIGTPLSHGSALHCAYADVTSGRNQQHRTRIMRFIMRSAFVTYPKACLLHAGGLVGLALLYQNVEVPWYISLPSFLLLALWPWLGPWQRQDHGQQAGTEDAQQTFNNLSQNLSRHTCHNALAAAEVAHAALQLSGRLQSQLGATEQISQAAEAITTPCVPSRRWLLHKTYARAVPAGSRICVKRLTPCNNSARRRQPAAS